MLEYVCPNRTVLISIKGRYHNGFGGIQYTSLFNPFSNATLCHVLLPVERETGLTLFYNLIDILSTVPSKWTFLWDWLKLLLKEGIANNLNNQSNNHKTSSYLGYACFLKPMSFFLWIMSSFSVRFFFIVFLLRKILPYAIKNDAIKFSIRPIITMLFGAL